MYNKICPGDPEIYQVHKRRAISKKCFKEDIRKRVQNTVSKFNMFTPHDKLVLGLSGGKDSYVLLDVLAQIHDPGKIIGVSIIEGIPGYNKPGDIRYMKALARDRGVDVIITSIREYVGETLYEIVKHSWKNNLNVSPCTFCGVLRRRILNYYGRILGADKTVTAHNLDDTAQTMLTNIFRGDIIGLIRQNPKTTCSNPKFVNKVKPLRYVYEYEAALYAAIDGFKFQDTECMFINQTPTFRAKIREVLYKLEAEYPGVTQDIVETLDDVTSKMIKKNLLKTINLPLCRLCGEPTNEGRTLCKLCELLGKAGIYNPIYQVNFKEYTKTMSIN
ncbi:MAG: TIGR00269 family protein [Desulfurococcales archaeon]|nr:TIGR00269 family protein [Desulfurococcales archaeon]